MSNLVTSSIVVLLFLILVMASLVYVCIEYKAEIGNLLAEIERKERMAKEKTELRKLYTYESPTDLIENVVHWKNDNQHLKLILDDGSVYVVNTPVEYKLIIQDQSEEGTDK